MKRAKLSGLVLILAMATNAAIFAQQAQPVIGYGTAGWGESVEEVTRKYPNIREGSRDENWYGVREFTEQNAEGGIRDRKFYFFNDRLYRVTVDYGERTDDQAREILYGFVDIYGYFDGESEDSRGQSGRIYDTLIIYRLYSENLTIVVNIVGISDAWRNLIRREVNVIYLNPETERLITVERERRTRERLGW